MLAKLRENKDNAIITSIVGVLVVVFIFWGSGLSQTQRTSVVARVNGKPIVDVTLGQAVGRQLERIRQFSNRPVSQEEEDQIFQQELDRLIESELVRQEARRLGVIVSDDELRESIVNALKKDDGKFDIKEFRRILRRNPNFELDQRDTLVRSRLLQLVMDAAQVSDADVLALYVQQNTKLNLEYAKLPFSRFEAQVKPTPQELEVYLKDHAEDVQARYEQDFDRLYNIPKKVKASHILLKLEENDPPEVKADLRRRMEAILAQAKTGDFAALAKQYSEDPGSTAKGGDLGYFDEKRMDLAFSKAAFSTSKGAISDIVESRFGFHIIKVEDIQEASVKKLEEVRTEIATKLIQAEKGPEQARAAGEKLRALWAKGGPELEKALKEASVTLETTGLVTRMGDSFRGLGRSAELADAVMALTAGSPGPDKLFTMDDGVALVRVKERQEADLQEFASKKSSLLQRALREKQTQLYEAWVADLKSKAKIDVYRTFGTKTQET